MRLVSVTRDDDEAHVQATVVAYADDAPPSGVGPTTPPATKEGDDGRRTSSAPPPPAVVLDETSAPATASPEQIRARIEAAEDEREKARTRGEAAPLLKLAPDIDSDDEETVIKDAGAVRDAIRKATGATRRPTLLGGFGGGVPPRSAYPTLVSPRALDPQAREATPPLDPRPPILPPPLSETGDDAASETERLYEEKRAKVRGMGLAVDHCQNGAHGCVVGDDDRSTPAGFTSESWRSMAAPDVCSCNCGACRRATACLLQAQREVALKRRRRE